MNTTVVTHKTRDPAKPSFYIGRPSALGNPFVLGRDGDRATVVARYATWLEERIKARDAAVLDALDRIRLIRRAAGEVQLVCYCSPLACHGDVVARVIEQNC